MGVADQIVRELADALRPTAGEPKRFVFPVAPRFLTPRLLALTPDERRTALEKLSVFAYYLMKERGSPEAGNALLSVLDEVVEKMKLGSQ